MSFDDSKRMRLPYGVVAPGSGVYYGQRGIPAPLVVRYGGSTTVSELSFFFVLEIVVHKQLKNFLSFLRLLNDCIRGLKFLLRVFISIHFRTVLS